MPVKPGLARSPLTPTSGEVPPSARELVGAITHRLRQPTSAIRWTFELILLHLNSPEHLRELAHSGVRESERMAGLLDEYAHLLEPELPEKHLEVFSMAALLEAVKHSQREAAKVNGVALRMQVSGACEVRAAKEKVARPIAMLVSHCISRGAAEVSIDCRETEEGIRIGIEDPSQADVLEINKLFDPLAAPPGGTGYVNVSLAVLRKELRARGGEARAERTATGGLRVLLEIPSSAKQAKS